MAMERTGWRRNGLKPVARPCRPSVEQLENRLVPAVYHVNTVHDTVAVNTNTGEDASGHVSLRAAVTAANAHPGSDTIILGAGDYSAQAGPLDIQGDLQIIGAGAGQTIIEARHLDRLFAVDEGSLELAGLTLNGGSASTLLKGTVHLQDCQITDVDIAATMPAPRLPLFVPARTDLPHVLEVPQQTQAVQTTPHLVGQAGAGATTAALDQLHEMVQETHQSFWRGQPEAAPEPPAKEKLEDMQQSSAARDTTIVVAMSASDELQESTTMQVAAANQAPETIKELWLTRVAHHCGPTQAILFWVVVGLCSFKKITMDEGLARVRASHPRRRLYVQRWHNPPSQSRRTRGPPASGPPMIKQGRQRCLPCSRLGDTPRAHKRHCHLCTGASR